MANLVIGGISGVGKSYLENELRKSHGYEINVKYTNRPYRPGEKESGLIVSMSDSEFELMKAEFFPVIYQTGFKYGYKKSDIIEHDHRTIAVPVKDIIPHTDAVRCPLIPIVLIVAESNLELLINRMKQREDFNNKSEICKKEIMQNIKERIEIAVEQIRLAKSMLKPIEERKGQVFLIEDDTTIYKEVLPFIKSLG